MYRTGRKTSRPGNAPVYVRKGMKTHMKNNKSFAQSLNRHFREGMILYAAANSAYPDNLFLMKMYQQAVEEE